ncbi:MAG TPA: hypothetical protein VGV09_13390 [Steroidobacteraceae bacterium]|nr:hypothetical protein [Steroidobacteraceae bacterium]
MNNSMLAIRTGVFYHGRLYANLAAFRPSISPAQEDELTPAINELSGIVTGTWFDFDSAREAARLNVSHYSGALVIGLVRQREQREAKRAENTRRTEERFTKSTEAPSQT